MKFIGLAFALSLFLSCDTMNKPLVIGHRGAMGHETENTIASIKNVVEGGHKIPLLQHVLRTINGKTKLNIELKGAGTTNRVNFIMNVYIEKFGWKTEDFLISSFRWDELREMRKLNPDVAIAILTEDDPADAISIAKELNAVAINPDFNRLNQENNLKIKDAGFKVYPWTVNEPEDIEAMKRLGVDGIITNYPERIH